MIKRKRFKLRVRRFAYLEHAQGRCERKHLRMHRVCTMPKFLTRRALYFWERQREELWLLSCGHLWMVVIPLRCSALDLNGGLPERAEPVTFCTCGGW